MQTELQRQHARHKAFHASIAQRAAACSVTYKPSRLMSRAEYVRNVLRMQSLGLPPRPHDFFEEYAWTTEICESEQARANAIARPTRTPSIIAIQQIVCEHFKVSRADLIGQCREGWILKPRHLAMLLCRRLTTRSFPYIGRQFGGRDHSTAINGIRRAEEMVAADPVIAAHVAFMTARFAEIT